ncbi:MAG: glycosyltransferase family 2 protein [Chlamydiia bacterium]|nr:glycosyltransferase family 2 protein [Chlamydiia bacterium]
MISVCILTKNSAATFQATLASISSFPEILVLDTGSNDETLQLCLQYPKINIFQVPFIGFGPLRNQAASLARNDWILALDSDEALSTNLLSEIASLDLNPSCVYSIPRHNFYNGKQIKGCGWHPDPVVRLYHRQHAAYQDVQVHESLQIGQMRVVPLRSPILHTPYRTTAEFLAKMQHYSTLFAKQHAGKKRSSLSCAMGHAFFAFVKSYLLKRGILDGKEGFIISLYNANTAFYKYLKLLEKQGADAPSNEEIDRHR